MEYIEISGRRIGAKYQPLVIAEIGINHNGNLNIAKEMVDSAWRAGAEIIKHQTHIVEDEMSHEAKDVIPGNSNQSIYDIMKKSALSFEDEKNLKEYVESKNMIFLSTPFSRAAADRLEGLGVVAYKIGSGECNNYPLIKHIAKFGKPMIISTGMNNIENIRKTVNIVEGYNVPYVLMHTTNLYPTPFNLVRLGAMEELKKEFPNAIIGLSDHTINNNACLAATALGACVLERHYTDKKERVGPDIICSADEKELRDLIKSSKEIFQMRGGTKEELKEEQITRDFAYATVVAIKNIKKGEKFTNKNIWVKRPGKFGILAEHYDGIIGKEAVINIKSDTHILWNMVK